MLASVDQPALLELLLLAPELAAGSEPLSSEHPTTSRAAAARPIPAVTTRLIVLPFFPRRPDGVVVR